MRRVIATIVLILLSSVPVTLQERLQLPNKDGIGQVPGHRRQRHRRQRAASRSRTGLPRSTRSSRSSSRSWSATTSTAARARQRLPREVRGALQAAARRRRQVLRLARQSRRPDPALLQELQHERREVLHLQGAQEGRRRVRRRALLRARQQLHVTGAAAVAEEGARSERDRLEDSLLPSSALLVRRDARLGRPRSAISWSRCSCSTAWTWSSPATNTSTNG